MTSLIRAAVLVPLQVDASGERRLVLIRRTAGDYAHQGQVAFPGGRYDPERDDGLLATALREAEEEIGLAPGAVRVLRVLPDQRTVSSSYLITPFVGEVPAAYPYRLDPREVEMVFTARLSRFVDLGQREKMEWMHEGAAYLVPCVRIDTHVIWGVTLRIIDELLGSEVPVTGGQYPVAGGR
jgi:8-oxo-dGTP pyrophosphatase MutT (NUDIX family)